VTLAAIILRGFWHRRLAHCAAILGVAAAAAAITGALIVGESVRQSLRTRALHRTAGFDWAVTGGDRFFREELSAAHPAAAPVLLLHGMARHSSGNAGANNIQLIGVDARYFARGDERAAPGGEGVLLNEALARQLNAKAGDEILLRMRRPGALAADAALSPGKGATGWRAVVAGVLPPEKGGDLDIRGSGLDTFNVFLPLARLQREAGLPGKANLLLTRDAEARPGGATPAGPSDALIRRHWTLADAGLEVTNSPTGLEIRASGIFLDDHMIEAARGSTRGGIPVLTYLANLIQRGSNATPYSMISAAGPPYTPEDMGADEILLTTWLAEDLGAKPGDKVRLSYFMPESGASLIEATNEFRVRGVVPMRSPHDDRTLMPDFPGIQEAERANDWDAGFPLTHTIRDKDESYWRERRGTPKAFVSLAAGQRMWASRFGGATSFRAPEPGRSKESLAAEILSRLEPSQAGLAARPLRAEALLAAGKSQDFGQLFLAFSMFILFSALLLMSLLFQFGLESRAGEFGALLAQGFSPERLRNLVFFEAGLIALAGATLGSLLGVGYARALLSALAARWGAAVGGLSITFHAGGTTLLSGILSALVVSLLVLWLSARRLAKRAPVALLTGEIEPLCHTSDPTRPRVAGALLSCAATGFLAWGFLGGELKPGAFFGAGGFLMLAGWAFFAGVARRVRASKPALTFRSMAVQSSARRPRRSMAVVALLSAGCFIITGVSAFRLDNPQSRLHRSGAGGFDLIASSSLPVLRDLSTAGGREALGLAALDANTVIVSCRVKEGDEASCLNLNRAAKPRLLGVRPEMLEGRFKFVRAADKARLKREWDLLLEWKADPRTGVIEIPAIGDANSIQWSMGKAVGDEITFAGDGGRVARVRIVAAVANSILQGSLVVDEAALLKAFPATAGHSLFLVESGAPRAALAGGGLSEALSAALEDYGLECVPAWRRLASLNAVQNTFLGAFQLLGGIGLLLGSVGLGVLVLRNVLERRAELAVMQASGFTPRRLSRLIRTEHTFLLVAGLGIGGVSAAAAIIPRLSTGGISWGAVAFTLLLALGNGLLWTWAASSLAMREPLLDSLRGE
jgi:ABC-type lipoprotein release transport system permease subunit